MGIRVIVAALTAVLAGAAPATAQSLAEVARKEQARREAVQTSGKTYTNADLTPDPHAGPARPAATGVSAQGDSPAGDTGASADATAAEGGSAAATAAEQTPTGNALDETFWRRRATALRGRVTAAEDALAQVSGTSQQDPRMRARMDKMRTDAEGVLARAQETLATFLRQAAEQGVPAAWLEP